MIHRENIEWCDVWVEAACDAVLPRVLLIGDSITRLYYPHVKGQLAGQCVCARIASSKCVADPMFFKELDLVLSDFQFSVIHFNNGLHGWDYDESTYALGMAKAFDLLLAHCGATHLIWGNTTPVWKTGEGNGLDTRTDRVKERNKLAAALAADRGIATKDLFSTVVERPEFFSDDGVHFVEAGQIALGQRVAREVQEKITTSGTEGHRD